MGRRRPGRDDKPTAHATRNYISAKGSLIRHQLTQTYWPVSNGAVERELRVLKSSLRDRRFGFGNRARTNRLLDLMALRANGLADEADYARIIRSHLIASAGLAPGRHLILDPRGTNSIRFTKAHRQRPHRRRRPRERQESSRIQEEGGKAPHRVRNRVVR